MITNYNGISFNLAHSYISVDAMFYVFDYLKRNIVIYNEYWEYQRDEFHLDYSTNGPGYSVYVNGKIYITGDEIINIYDKYLNLAVRSVQYGRYRGIFFNSSNGLIYSADILNGRISSYNQSLVSIDHLDLAFKPWFLTEYNGMMILTENSFISGNIYYYQNNVLIKNITTVCGYRVNSILFDNFNHMIVLCNLNLYIYHTNGTYTGINILNVCTMESFYINFDSKNRLVIICKNGIYLYY